MALDLTYDPNWKPASSGSDLDLTYQPDWKPKSGVIESVKNGANAILESVAAPGGPKDSYADASAVDVIKQGVAGSDAALGVGLGRSLASAGKILQAPIEFAKESLAGGLVAISDKESEWYPARQEIAREAAANAQAARAENIANGNAFAAAGVEAQRIGREHAKEQQQRQAEYAPMWAKQSKNIDEAEGFIGKSKAFIDNPIGGANVVLQSAPDTIIGMGAGKVASLLGAGEKAVGAVALGTEAAQSGLSTREGVEQFVMQQPLDALAKNSPRFNELAKTMTPEDARIALANELGAEATLPAAIGTAIGGKLVGEDVAIGKTIANNGKMTGKEFLSRTGTEIGQEGLQNPAENYAQYRAQSQVDPNQKFDLGGSIAEGMFSGLGMGAPTHGAGYIASRIGNNGDMPAAPGSTPPPAAPQPLPDTGPMSRSANVAMETGAASQAAAAQAADVLGVPEGDGALSTAANVTDTAAGAADPVGATAKQNDGFINLAAYNITTPDPLKPNDAPLSVDDALFELDVLQARADKGKLTPESFSQSGIAARLDTAQAMRINEQIKAGDTSFIGALKARIAQPGNSSAAPNTETKSGPTDMQNRDRTRAASVMQMQKIAQNPDYELASIARDSNGAPMVATNGTVQPQAVGKKERVTLPDGTKINTNYAVVEADSLSASHFADGRENPSYGKDGKLTALNNGRTAGLVESYGIGKAAGYRAALEADTDGHGIAREVIAGMKAPVLVRLYDPATVDQANLGARSNQASALGMGTAEQASSDAAMLDSMDGLNPDDNGDFTTSRDFIKRFMGRLPQTEQANMVDADGQLAPAGYARIRNAVLAKAYGNSPVLRRMTESLDDNMRNVTKALVKVAPRVAQARQAIAEGALFDADITPDLIESVSTLAALKDQGISVNDALAQGQMFGGYSDEVREILQFLGENLRRPNKIAEFIDNYFTALEAAGSPNQGSLIGDNEAPAKADLLKAAKDKTNGQQASGSLFGTEEAGGQAGTKLSRAQGSTPGSQENEAAGNASQSEWVAFPAETGTLGIPRAEMPQIKGDHRGALINFLDARGIANKTVDVSPDRLRPTQAEFSTEKAERWGEVREGVDRSVLASSDGYILDGHHQWIAALATNEPVKAIVFNAPISKLLTEVFQFPSVKRSEGAAETGRAKARQDFDAAMADLGAVLRQINPGVRMMTPEEKVKLMPTLVKLFESGIKVVGFNMKDLIADVRKAMRASTDDFVRKFWNKVDDKTYREAAAKAIDNVVSSETKGAQQGDQGDLFAAPVKELAKEVEVGATMDLFASITAAAPQVASKPDVAPGQGAQQPTQGSGNGQRQKTEVLTEAGAGSMSTAPAVPKLGKRATAAVEILKAGGYWRKALESSFIGGEKFETRLRYANGGIVSGFGFKTFTEMESAGMLQSREVPKSTVYAQEWALREKPLAPKAVNPEAPAIPAGWKLAENGKEYIDEHGFVRGLKMSAGDRAVEQSFYDAIRTDTEGLIQRYLDSVLDPQKDGLLVDPDRVKELSEDFKNDRALANAVYEPSSHMAKLIFSRLVRDHLDKPVVFTAGGGGSGKTEAMPIAYTVANITKGGVIVDSTLSAINSAKKKIDEVLGAGGEVSIIYTNAPVEKAFRFAMKRPRVVRMVTLAQAHQGASDTIRALAEHYKDNPKVSVVIVNNLGEINDMHVGSIDDVPHYDYNEVERRLYGIAEQALQDGTIDQKRFDDIFRGYGRPGGAVSVGETGGVGNANELGRVQEVRGEAGRTPEGVVNEPGQNNPLGAEGQEPGAAPAAGEGGDAQGVRNGPGRANQRADRNPDNGTGREQGSIPGAVPGSSGKGGDSQPGAQPGDRNRPRGNAGVPAGRDIPAKTGRNYAFGDGDLTYTGSWQTKARQNVEAVELLKKLQAENRQATREEQSVLAKFAGWGASEIANNIWGDRPGKITAMVNQYNTAVRDIELAPNGELRPGSRGYYPAYALFVSAKSDFQYGKPITLEQLKTVKPTPADMAWAALRDRLNAVMTPEELAEAARSTQYAHYTSKPVVNSMLSAIERMGFKGGTILEPGAGIGVFAGLMNPAMATNSVYTGIEFDSITGGILKQLFPDERILVESFVDSKLPENYYDVAFGNPPFAGQVKVLADPKYAKLALVLHDYFFAKSIDSVKPGGLVIFISSRYTMDKKSDKARAYMAERADLVGAIRLPQTAFQKNAGTEVVTDVLFLRKKVPGETFDKAQPWAGLATVKADKDDATVNEYFAAHPEMVLGQHSLKGSMYGKDEYTVLPNGDDIEAQFDKAAQNLPENVFVPGRGSAAEAARVREMDFNPKAKKEGSFYVTDAGVLMQREGGVGVRAEEKHQKNAELIKDYIPLRDAVKQAQYDQLNDGDWEASLRGLQKAYAAFVKKNGQLHKFTTYMQRVKVDEMDDDGIPTGKRVEDEEERRRFPTLTKIGDDPEWTLVSALENFSDDTGKITESSWLTERTLNRPIAPEVRTPGDALLASLNDVGHVDIGDIADRIGLSDQETIDALGTMIYDDPVQGWVMADEYLSGNVVAKLHAAEEAVKSDKRFERNIDALKAAQPPARTFDQITPQIGMNWIPGKVYQDFLYQLAGVKAKIEYVERVKGWTVVVDSGYTSPRATVDWGVGDKAHAGWLIEKALTGARISLNKAVSDGKGGVKNVFDPERTEAANQKLKEMREAFKTWLFTDANRTDELVRTYNDKFNTNVQRKFDGKHLTLPGASKQFKIFDHVKRGAWRVIQTGNTYLAHAVGSGKTFEMVISAMEQKRLGLVKKPMMVVPNHMLQQFATEWQQLYPTARLMVADEQGFTGDNRRKFVARVAMSDLDGVVMTHSSFKLLDLDPEFKQKMIEQELEFMRASYEEAGGDLDDIGNKKARKDPKVKRIEAQIEKLEQQLAEAMSSEGKDKNVRFDEMGVDFLYVDEAHLFRKLSFATNRQGKGISPEGSQMAWDLYMKSRWLAERNPTRFMVLASGTPITNTTAELFTVQRYLAPQVLEEKGLSSFDDWAANFGSESTEIEATSSGKYEPVTRFSEFVNVGEMTQMFRDFADVLNEDHLAALLGDKRPKVQGGARKAIITPKTNAYVAFQQQDLIPRIEASKKWKPTFQQPYNPDPIININTDARLAAIDMRFMSPSLPSDPDSKLNRMIDNLIQIYKDTSDNAYREKATKDKAGNEVLGKFEPLKGAAQMVFYESGFGKMVAARRGFNARAWLEKRLRDAGIPTAQVAFMEDYKKSSAKLKLFNDVNTGKVRILVGSSAAMGTGVNAQQRLIALHHLDAPMVPATLEQREGRIVRQGNKNPEVQIYAYSMKGSFDENQWGMLARKKFFIDQALSGDPNLRTIEDVGEVSQMQITAGLIAENPYVMQHAGAKAEVEKLQRLFRNHEDQRGKMRNEYDWAGRAIESMERQLVDAEKFAARAHDLSGAKFEAKAGAETFTTRKEWGAAILADMKERSDRLQEGKQKVGEMSGFDVEFVGAMRGGEYRSEIWIQLQEPLSLAADPATDPVGLSLRASNAVAEVARLPSDLKRKIGEQKDKRNALESRLEARFPLAEQLANKIQEVADLEVQMQNYGKASTGLEREQELEDAWQKKTGAITPLFSRGNGAGMAVRDLQATVDRVARGFTNLPKVHVFASPADLSTTDPDQSALRAFIQKAGAWEDVEGATHQGEIYMFASGLADEARAEHVLATHEVTHYGLRGAAGKALDSALQHIWLNNAAVRKQAAAIKQRNGLESNVEAVEEVLADMETANLAKLNGWRKVVKVLRDWLNKAGAVNLAAKLDAWMKSGLDGQQKADLFVADLVRAARNYARKGKPNGGVMMDGTRLADGTLAEDVERQEKFLTREAKARGYQSIDELAEKNYPVFEKLATMWREENPVENALLSRVAKEWKSAENPPVPGKPFMVYRLAKNGEATLSNVNAADAEGLAAFLMSVEDYDSSISSQGDTVFAYEVTADEFGEYATFNRGRADTENKVGMMAKWGGHWLSFPAGAKFKSRLVGSFSLDKARDKLEELHDYRLFDDAGSIKGATAIREVMYQDFDGANLPRLSRRVESKYEIRPDAAINLPIDGAKLQALRRAAARLERPEAGITFRVTEGGKAIATGPKGTRVPERYIQFANDNGLTFEARRLPIGSGTKAPAMPETYRADGALYFGEMVSNQFPNDRTGKTRFSRAANLPTPAERAEAIIQRPAVTMRPIDAIMRTLTTATRFDKATSLLYDKAGNLIDFMLDKSGVGEQIKAGVVADYGIPEAVIDRRVAMGGAMQKQMREAGALIDRLATMTRAESRVAYEWMNNNDPQALKYFEAQLPPESVKVMEEVKAAIDNLSLEAMRLGQLSPDAFKRNRFEYLRRSYVKHTADLTKGEGESRKRAIAILGDQYKGRGMTDAVDMAKVQNIAPEWWGRKLQAGKADKGLHGEKFIRLERRAPVGEGTMPLEAAQGPGNTNPQKKGKLLEVAYWPAGEKMPAKYSAWDEAGTWEVRDTKGGKLIVWRDFTKQERVTMGEIDEARYAIAKTLHGMTHDVETGRYLEWLAQRYAKMPGETIDGEIVEASERMLNAFAPGTWVLVPDTKVEQTGVAKYGKLAGKYLPGPIWNDVRQTVGFRFKPFGETYAAILSAWKTSKTALSPAVHMNNVMANLVMADWHDVTAGHMVKALRVILGANEREGKGILGRTGNAAARLGMVDRQAAQEILNRFSESGGTIGTWMTSELQKEQLEPLLAALEKEIGTVGQQQVGQVGAMVALQKLMQLRFPSAWEAFKPTLAGKALTTEARNLMAMYEAEDQVFRLAKWLKEKEDGASDIQAGKSARKSFLDYHINAPWIQAMRSSAFPFISFTYRAVPMMLEIAAKKPHKLMKLALLAGALNALGYMLSGGDEDEERKLLPEEKAGRVWGMVPKLIRMPWNDANGSPVFLDIRRWIPVGDIFDTGATHTAFPVMPAMVPGGPLAVLAEIGINKAAFTGKSITQDTDTLAEKSVKVADHLYKAFAPNIAILPGTYAWTAVSNANKGKTDAFGREQSVGQAIGSSLGVKLGSYPKDVLQLNEQRKMQRGLMELDQNITQLKREYGRKGLTLDEFSEQVQTQQAKKLKLMQEHQERTSK